MNTPMQRRSFITLLGGAAAAWPLTARAQQPAIPVIGFLSSRSANEDSENRLPAFRQALSEAGFAEGRNVTIEYRFAEGHYDRLPALASDLVRRNVAVIVTDGGVPAALAAKAATTTIPIVFGTGTDPVAFGLVASLARPGGNLTGATSLQDEVAPKRLQFMHEVFPVAAVVSLLVNPTNPNHETQSKDMQAAAGTLGLQLRILHASTDADIEKAFATVAQIPGDPLVIGPDTFFFRHEFLAALSARYRIPTISFVRGFAAAGGLMSYGPGGDGMDVIRIVGNYTGRILKGAKPADLPVQQATKIGLIINMKTAKALGVTFPTAVLVRADEVIE